MAIARSIVVILNMIIACFDYHILHKPAEAAFFMATAATVAAVRGKE